MHGLRRRAVSGKALLLSFFVCAACLQKSAAEGVGVPADFWYAFSQTTLTQRIYEVTWQGGFWAARTEHGWGRLRCAGASFLAGEEAPAPLDFEGNDVFTDLDFVGFADFVDIDNDGLSEVITIASNKVVVSRFSDGLAQEVAQSPTDARLAASGVEDKHVAVLDLDGDGVLEVVYSWSTPWPDHAQGLVVLTLDETNGTLHQTSELVADGTAGYNPPATGDVNGDGLPDLAFSDDNGNIYLIAFSGDAVRVVAQFLSRGGAVIVYMADLDGDGVCELIEGTNGGLLSVVRFDGAFGYTRVWEADLERMSYSICFADFDKDGTNEIVVAHNDWDRRVSLFAKVGNNSWSEKWHWDTHSSVDRDLVMVEDCDDNGDVDLVVSFPDGRFSILSRLRLREERVFARRPAPLVGAAATQSVIAVSVPGDVDGDRVVGMSDLRVVEDHFLEETAAGTDVDVTGDGVVDIHDLTYVGARFGDVATVNVEESGLECSDPDSAILGVSLSIPEAAVTSETTFSLSEITDASDVYGMTPAGAAVALGPSGSAFERFVTVYLPFDADALGPDADFSRLEATLWRDGQWTPVGVDAIDRDRSRLAVKTPHFSLFSVWWSSLWNTKPRIDHFSVTQTVFNATSTDDLADGLRFSSLVSDADGLSDIQEVVLWITPHQMGHILKEELVDEFKDLLLQVVEAAPVQDGLGPDTCELIRRMIPKLDRLKKERAYPLPMHSAGGGRYEIYLNQDVLTGLVFFNNSGANAQTITRLTAELRVSDGRSRQATVSPSISIELTAAAGVGHQVELENPGTDQTVGTPQPTFSWTVRDVVAGAGEYANAYEAEEAVLYISDTLAPANDPLLAYANFICAWPRVRSPTTANLWDVRNGDGQTEFEFFMGLLPESGNSLREGKRYYWQVVVPDPELDPLTAESVFQEFTSWIAKFAGKAGQFQKPDFHRDKATFSPVGTFVFGSLPPYVGVRVSAGTKSREVDVEVTLTHQDSTSLDIDAYYSLDGGDTWNAATCAGDVSGLASAPAGTQHTIVWNAFADLGHGTYEVALRVGATDGIHAVSGQSAPFPLDNGENAAPSVFMGEIASPQSGDIPLAYQLHDNESDVCSLLVEYHDGSSWHIATTATGASDTNGLASSPAGTPHTFTWDSATDLPDASTSVRVRMTPSDERVGFQTESPEFTVDNANGSPSINVSTPSSPSSGDISVAFTLTDRESDSCSINAEYYADGTWRTATPASGQAMSGLSSSAGGTEHTFTWSSGSDLEGRSVTGVKVKMQADDGHGQSAWDESGAFTVNNVNASPSINVGTPSSPSSGDISVAFTIADAESDSCSISAQYYADSAWQTATPASGQAMSGLSSSAGGTEHTFTWSSGSDLGGRSVTGVKVKMQADDGHSQSAWDESGPFTVDNAVVVTLQYKHTGGSLTDLIDGTVLSGNDIFLYSPVTGEIALEAIQYYIDGTYWGDGKTDSTPLGKRPWDTTEETNGDYTLEVRVWASGDVVATHSVSITISN